MMRPWVLVTGSAQNLGRALAIRLAKEGYSLVLHYRTSENKAREVAATCRQCGSDVHLLQADLSTVDGALSLAAGLKKTTDALYGLINNVGHYLKASALDTSAQDAQELMTVNLLSPMVLIQELAPLISASRGVIINIGTSGILSGHAVSQAPWYMASKAALASMTRSLAKELSCRQVRVNMISPGVLTTSVDLEERLPSLPLKRAGTLEEVADGVMFLMKATYVTGQHMEIAGGFGL